MIWKPNFILLSKIDMYNFVCMFYLCNTCLSGDWSNIQKISDSLDFVLQIILSHHMAARNQTQELWRSSHWKPTTVVMLTFNNIFWCFTLTIPENKKGDLNIGCHHSYWAFFWITKREEEKYLFSWKSVIFSLLKYDSGASIWKLILQY